MNENRKSLPRTILYVALLLLSVWALYRGILSGHTFRIAGGVFIILFIILDYFFNIRRFLTLRTPEYKKKMSKQE